MSNDERRVQNVEVGIIELNYNPCLQTSRLLHLSLLGTLYLVQGSSCLLILASYPSSPLTFTY
jgi:hypothetical protein